MRYLTTEIIRVLIFAVRSVVLAASCTTQCERISSLYSTCLITSTLHAAAKLRRHAPCCGAARDPCTQFERGLTVVVEQTSLHSHWHRSTLPMTLPSSSGSKASSSVTSSCTIPLSNSLLAFRKKYLETESWRRISGLEKLAPRSRSWSQVTCILKRSLTTTLHTVYHLPISQRRKSELTT